MPDRLTELKRQRAAIAEHLQWLDREISALEPWVADPTPTPLKAPPHATAAGAISPLPPPHLGNPGRESPDPTLTLLQEAERQRGQFSKSGCWIVFAMLLLLGIGGITTYILVRYG